MTLINNLFHIKVSSQESAAYLHLNKPVLVLCFFLAFHDCHFHYLEHVGLHHYYFRFLLHRLLFELYCYRCHCADGFSDPKSKKTLLSALALVVVFEVIVFIKCIFRFALFKHSLPSVVCLGAGF